MNYNGKNNKNHDTFVKKGKFLLFNKDFQQEELEDVISTGVAPFGTIIELAEKIIVLRSDGITDVFKGELVHWRIFPRSEHYSNQLHLIYENHIEIVSFVHDYFVDQDIKIFGFYR